MIGESLHGNMDGHTSPQLQEGRGAAGAGSDLHGRVPGEGRVPVRQLQDRDAERPDVRGSIVPAGDHIIVSRSLS